MIRVAIWGESALSEYISTYINKIYNKVAVMCGGEELTITAILSKTYFDNNIPRITIQEYIRQYSEGEIDALIIPINHFGAQTSVLTDIIRAGLSLDDVYILKRLELLRYDNNEAILDHIVPYLSSKYIPYLEYHVADKCNLNCIACEHYSGLVKEECFPDFPTFTKEIHRMKELIDDIGTIRILGGEPLLNPQLADYVKLTRELYPCSDIRIVTNGILVRNMSQELMAAIRDNKASIHISSYPVMIDKMHDIRSFLNENGIKHATSYTATKFQKKQTLVPSDNTNQFFKCYQAHCNNLYQGKMAACFLPFTTKYYNGHFGTQLPEDGAIAIMDESLTSEELLWALLQPIERCKYCTDPVDVDWDYVRDADDLSNWLVEYPKKPDEPDALVTVYCRCLENNGDIEKCIQSVLAQNYHRFELYILDYSVNADDRRIIDEYAKRDNRIIPIYSEDGQNIVLEDYICQNENSKYFTIIDSCDYLEENYLKQLVVYSERYKLDMGMCGARVYTDDYRVITSNIEAAADMIFNTNERELYWQSVEVFLGNYAGKLISSAMVKQKILPANNHSESPSTFYRACFDNSIRVGVIMDKLATIKSEKKC